MTWVVWTIGAVLATATSAMLVFFANEWRKLGRWVSAAWSMLFIPLIWMAFAADPGRCTLVVGVLWAFIAGAVAWVGFFEESS